MGLPALDKPVDSVGVFGLRISVEFAHGLAQLVVFARKYSGPT
jgi:hypothetical protein